MVTSHQGSHKTGFSWVSGGNQTGSSIDLPPGPFDVICADPPWHFKTYSPKGRGRCPDGDSGVFHYETMSLDEIERLPVAEIAAFDSILFLWATVPMLTQALHVMGRWGFQYKSSMAWVKLIKDGSRPAIGTGYWLRNSHETVLIGTRGRWPTPEPKHRPSSVIMSPRREHSRKPPELQNFIDAAYPKARKLELFSRTSRPGWSAWGDQIDKFKGAS